MEIRSNLARVKSLKVFLVMGALSTSFSCLPSYGEDLSDVEVHSFLSQGFINTTSNNYLTNSALGSFDFTEAGINFTKQLQDNLRVGIQLFSERLGPTQNFGINLDWAYLDYRWSDFLGFRFGKVKIPFGLYNDISDIDAARAPILLPQSVYPVQNRNYLLAQTGGEIYGYTGRGSLGALEYRFYGGTISLQVTNTPGSPVQVQSLDVPYVYGGRVMWETPLEGLRVGGTFQSLILNTTLLVGSTAVTAQIPALLWVGSVEFNKQDLLVAAECSRWDLTSQSSNAALFPTTSSISERAYVMAAYRVNKWLQPAAYFSILYPNIDNLAGPENQANDLSATLRFDVNQYWLIKVEGHYMRGTAALDTTLNNNMPLNSLSNNWGAFLVKTTGYF